MKQYRLISLIFLFSLIVSSTKANLRLASIFADHMILQRDRPIKVWGWGDPNTDIQLTFNQKTLVTKVACDSSWSITLPPTAAGKPHSIAVRGGDKTLNIHDVLLGDVWICSGQSNMSFRFNAVQNIEKERLDVDYPMIRQLEVSTNASEVPLKDIKKSEWLICGPATVSRFSAVAFFFAKDVFHKTGVPVAIIHSSWGGSPISTFMSKDALADFPAFKAQLSDLKPGYIAKTNHNIQQKRDKWIADFYRMSGNISSDGKLMRDSSLSDTTYWHQTKVPVIINSQGTDEVKDLSWFKKEFEISARDTSADMILDLGHLNSINVTFFNSHRVGEQLNLSASTRMVIPRNLLKAGKNEILIYSYSEQEQVGTKPIVLPYWQTQGSKQRIFLEGDWMIRQINGTNKSTLPGRLPAFGFEHSHPTLVYNAMIAPFASFAAKGVIWYQGEHSANRKAPGCFEYQKMLTTLIRSWRIIWSDPDMPFLIVQLPNWGEPAEKYEASGLAIIREAQFNVSQRVPNTYTSVNYDVGDAADIHPKNKRAVGQRLALIALREVYFFKDVTAQGPQFKSMKKKNKLLSISFEKSGGNLVSTGSTGSINGFVIAGPDLKFYRAEARISRNKVLVSSKQVPNPVHVRYAFEANPPEVNLYNKQGLPAAPFRTDDSMQINEN